MKEKKKEEEGLPHGTLRTEMEAEEDRFIFTLISSGLAAFPDEMGKLPQGATHILYMENGRLKAKRVCFS